MPALIFVAALTGVLDQDPDVSDLTARDLVPLPLGCAVLCWRWKRLLSYLATQLLTLVAAALMAHQLYLSIAFFLYGKVPTGVITLFCALVVLAGCVSFLVYARRTQRNRVLCALSVGLVWLCFVFGSGNPHWSRYIYIWQMHYSPWRASAVNVPTSRLQPWGVRGAYVEWDRFGGKIQEVARRDGEWTLTIYHPDGRKKSEVIGGVTWMRLPNGRTVHYYVETGEHVVLRFDRPPP